jgi:hypothetical protein
MEATSTIAISCLASERPDCVASLSMPYATPLLPLLIQNGASLAYVKEQMGHSSIQVTVDTYGHLILIPGGNIAWVDALDEQTSPQKNATPAQQADGLLIVKVGQAIENNGAGEGNRTPDLRFTKPLLYRLSYAGQTRKCSPYRLSLDTESTGEHSREENRTADALRQLNPKGV